MKYAVVTMTELLKGNTRNCLSPKRALKMCFKCHLYPNCESKIINKKYDALQNKKTKLGIRYRKDLDSICKEVENI